MSKLAKTTIFAALLVVSFYAGMKAEQFMALDRCLDMGGGRHPGGYAVCVVEIKSNS